MKKRQLLTAAVLCTAFLAGGTTALAADNATIHTGVHVDGIQLLCTPETLARAIKMSPSGHRAHP